MTTPIYIYVDKTEKSQAMRQFFKARRIPHRAIDVTENQHVLEWLKQEKHVVPVAIDSDDGYVIGGLRACREYYSE